MEECGILSKAFSSSNEMISFFSFVYMVDYIDNLYVEPPLYLFDKAYLIMVDDPLNMFLDLVCKYFIECILHQCL